MKCICVSCFNYYDNRMKAITEFFSSHNYEVTYIIADYNHFDKCYFVADYQGCMQLHVPPYERNLSVERLISHRVFAKSVYAKLQEIRPGIVYCMFPPNSLVQQVVKYKRESNAKIIFDCYDLWPESFPYEKYGRLLSKPFELWRKLRDDYINNADLILTVSDKGKEKLEKIVDNVPIKVLLPAIDDKNLPAYTFENSSTLSLCYLGNVNHIANIELGIKLLSRIAEQKNVIVHFIGEGQRYIEFTEALKKNGITVIGHGVVFDMEEKNRIFAQCQFGLNIPREAIASSMSLKSIEYLRAGLPFINSGIADTWDIVEQQNVGINILEYDIEKTVDEILRITPNDIFTMHNNCLNYYSLKFANQNLEGIFKESF